MNATIPGVSIVICTRDRPALLESALDAIRSCLRPEDEAVVVDSASRDPAVRRIVEDAGIRYLRCARPGAARARNLGFAATTRPLIACTDDDCLPQPPWTEVIERAFALDPGAGFLTGRVVPDRQRRMTLSTITSEDPRRFSIDDDLDEMGSGANMAFRREAFESVKGFDEALGPGGRLGVAEDRDLFWRLLHAGWTGCYEPASVVTHKQWRNERTSIYRKYAYGRGRGAFVSKVRRLDPQRGRMMLREDLWDRGVRSAWRNLRTGYETGALGDLVRTAGIAIGAAQARLIRIDNGHFRS